MSKIIFKKKKKTFEGGIQVLNGVSLEIEKGESHIILGQSGGGKSVLIKCLLGILDLTEGNIIVDEISVNDSDQKKEYMKCFHLWKKLNINKVKIEVISLSNDFY